MMNSESGSDTASVSAAVFSLEEYTFPHLAVAASRRVGKGSSVSSQLFQISERADTPFGIPQVMA